MCFPCTFCNMHIREHCFETGVFRTAGINAKTNLSSAFPHMADSHLSEFYAIQRTFYAKVIFSAAEAVPHDFDICRNSRCRPVGITVICNDRPEMLKRFVFIFHRAFQPVFGIKVHDDTALIKTVMAFCKVRFHNKREILFFTLPIFFENTVDIFEVV